MYLLQIVAYADTHFLIEKRVDAGRTRATLHRLDRAGRVEEIGRMLGGTEVTPGIRASAREMLDRRSETMHQGESKGESERAKAKVAPARKQHGGRRTPG